MSASVAKKKKKKKSNVWQADSKLLSFEVGKNSPTAATVLSQLTNLTKRGDKTVTFA